MKKIIGISLCCLLGGCVFPAVKALKGAAPSVNYPHQDLAPLPWISVLPTKRTMAFKEVDFKVIAQQLRFDLRYYPHATKSRYVTMALVDYAILPPETSKTNNPDVFQKGVSYSKNYVDLPERYALTIRLYEHDHVPPHPPLFEETIYMPTFKAPPQEAIRMMAQMLIEDHHDSPLKKMVDSLY